MNQDTKIINPFVGCGTAMVTPFKGENVDMPTYVNTVKRQVEAGMHFLLALGTTAETPCLSDDEKIAILEATQEHGGGLPLMVGVGSNSLQHTLQNIRLLAPRKPDGLLVVTPYYNKPTQAGLYEYFRVVASNTDLPVVLYNVPCRTGVNLSAETTLRLAEIPNIVAIKEASGKYVQVEDIINMAPEGFAVLSGNDEETLSLMSTGAAGVVSVVSNIVPRLTVRFVEAIQRGDFAQAKKLHFCLLPLFRNCFVESNPIPVKAAMALMGLMEDTMRLPLMSASATTTELMRTTLSEVLCHEYEVE